MSYHQHPRFNPPSAKSVVAPLPRRRRRSLFLSLILLFVVAVPIFVFYATGYRYDFFAPDASITATGGLYISVGAEEGEVFLNERRVEDSRIFRSALYIQNINPGLQRLHVQVPGYHTWVKELPVYPHIVTEVGAFRVPVIAQVRPITEYVTSTGTPVYLNSGTTTSFFADASTTVPFLATTTKATTTFERNTEYAYVHDLFGTSSATTSTPFINRVVDEAIGIFDAGENSTTSSTSSDEDTATTTITQSDMMLFKRDNDIVVRFVGSERNIPYYFCIPDDIGTTTARYEAQVIAARQALAEERLLETELETTTTADRECRREIVMDRQGHMIRSFVFMPGTTDLVLLHRDDGIVVTEVDDRAWQNTQTLYAGDFDAVVVDGGRIFVKDGTMYFELLTKLPTV